MLIIFRMCSMNQFIIKVCVIYFPTVTIIDLFSRDLRGIELILFRCFFFFKDVAVEQISVWRDAVYNVNPLARDIFNELQ